MMRRSLLASVMLAAFTGMLAIHADEPTKKTVVPQINTGKDGQPTLDSARLAEIQKKVQEKYGQFARALNELAENYAKSPDKALNEKAKYLRKILEESDTRGINASFTQFIKFLSEQKLTGTEDIAKAVSQCQKLAKDLSDILAMVRNDNGASNKRDERLALEKM